MKRNTRVILLLVTCAFGSILVGCNGGKVNEGLHLLLYIIGLAMISCSLALLGRVWRRK